MANMAEKVDTTSVFHRACDVDCGCREKASVGRQVERGRETRKVAFQSNLFDTGIREATFLFQFCSNFSDYR
jgi:hypothetical protein